jgi:hypothetical protein
MADERKPNESIEDDDATRMSDEELVGMADDDEEFEDEEEDEEEDEDIEEGE